MPGCRLAWLLPIALLIAVAPPLHADELKQKAQDLLTEGNALAREGDFGAALTKFRTAHELYPSPKLLLNIGTSLRHTGRYAEAAETYEIYLAHPEAEPARTDEVRGLIDELDQLVGRLEVTVSDSDARVSLDGHTLRRLGRELRVDPGRHTLVAEKAGREPTVRHFTVAPKQLARVDLIIAEPGEPPPEPTPVRAIVGYGVAGLGGAAMIVGGIIGAVALGTKSDADDQCADSGEFSGYCNPEGSDLSDDARAQGAAATTVFILGFATFATGLAVAITAPDPSDDVQVSIGPGSVRLRW